MTTIEEQIWDYLDGLGDVHWRADVANRITSAPDYQKVYEEIKAMHLHMQELSLEEPSMSFTRNVMEAVKLEIAPVSLKTRIDKRIIYSIAAFFILAMTTLLVFAISQSHVTFSKPAFTLQIDLGHYITPFMIKAFFFADIIIALLYLDRLMRKRHI